VPYGALWYWQTRHRHQIEFNDALRQQTLQIIEATRDLLNSGVTPKAKYEKKCQACSLYELCNPKLTFRDKSRAYVKAIYQESVVEETQE
jgi:CRISPR-associated exonuclease Cas4